jgi:hypothetical protein
MTLDEAIKKAETTKADPYTIPFEMANTAKSLVGKTLRSKDPKNANALEVVKWVGQNYVLRINGKDYSVTPVMWVIQNLDKMTY